MCNIRYFTPPPHISPHPGQGASQAPFEKQPPFSSPLSPMEHAPLTWNEILKGILLVVLWVSDAIAKTSGSLPGRIAVLNAISNVAFLVQIRRVVLPTSAPTVRYRMVANGCRLTLLCYVKDCKKALSFTLKQCATPENCYAGSTGSKGVSQKPTKFGRIMGICDAVCQNAPVS